MALRVSKDCQKFGSPLYAGGWINDEVIVMAGGGGRSATGIVNRALLASFDRGILSDPNSVLTIPTDCPVSLAVHPTGRHIVAPLGAGGCSYFVVDTTTKSKSLSFPTEPASVDSTPISPALSPTAIGSITRAVYTPRASTLVLATPKGTLLLHDPLPPFSPRRALSHPSLQGEIKDLDAYEGEKGIWIVAVDEKGGCVVMNGTSRGEQGGGGCVLSPPPVNLGGKVTIARARFHPQNASLLVLMHCMTPKGRVAYLAVYSLLLRASSAGQDAAASGGDSGTWSFVQVRRAHADAATALAISPSGKFLATGTVEGDVMVLDGRTLRVVRRVKAAHMIAITGAAFSPNGRTLLTVSADSSARCTVVEGGGGGGGGVVGWMLLVIRLAILIILLGYLLHYLEERGLLTPHLLSTGL